MLFPRSKSTPVHFDLSCLQLFVRPSFAKYQGHSYSAPLGRLVRLVRESLTVEYDNRPLPALNESQESKDTYSRIFRASRCQY